MKINSFNIVKISFFTSFLLGMFCLLSCNDDNGGQDNDSPVFTLIGPVDNDVYDSYQNIPLEIQISDASTIVEYQILIRNTQTGELEDIISEFNSTNEVLVKKTLSIEVPVDTRFAIEVEAMDDFDNKTIDVLGEFLVKRLEGGTLDINFNVTYDGSPFKILENYVYPSGETMYFTRLSLYMSQIALSDTNGQTEIKEIDFINMTNHFADSKGLPFSYKIGGIGEGDYSSISFNVGLTPDLNDARHIEYPPLHPLGRSGEHWPSWDSYVFFKLEGRFDEDNDGVFETEVVLHLGSDEALRNISLQKDVTLLDEQISTLDINMDIKDFFISESGDIYDLKIENNAQIHDLEQIDLVNLLSDNLKNLLN